MKATRAAVEFRAVRKLFGEFAAVRDISFTVEAGSLVTLLGPSGCGKTTTLRLVAGLEHASSGSILIGGKDVTRLAASERNVSMVFQSYALFPHMNVLDNVCYGLRASGIARPRAEEMARAKLRLVGLSGFEARLPSELSGGQQQRVAVARAIVLEPQVLLFDEPLSNLDAKLRRHVREEIRALQQDLRLTVVYVTHDQEEALAVSDRVIVMNAGVIAQEGTPRELYEQPVSRFVADFIGDANLLPVHVTRLDAELAAVRLGAVEMNLPHRGVTDGPAEIAIRPDAIRLTSAGWLAGRVVRAAYLGSHMEYEVAVEDVPKPLFVVATDVARPLPAGSEVGIDFDPTGVAVVASD